MTISTKLTTITPAMARTILETDNYEDNRRISEKWVSYLIRQIQNGLWRTNGESIVFDKRGKLLDGQHRLTAIGRAGKPVKVVVVKGVETDTFTTLDQGRNRSVGAVFSMRDEKAAHLLAAICRKVHAWETVGSLAHKQRISPDECFDVLDRHPELRESAEVADQIRKRVPVDGSMIGFTHWLFKQAYPRKADRFFDALRTGVATSAKDPCVVLRERFFRERQKNRRRWGATELLAILVRAWNYHVKNKQVANLAIKPDKDGTFKVPYVSGLGRDQGGKRSLATSSGADDGDGDDDDEV